MWPRGLALGFGLLVAASALAGGPPAPSSPKAMVPRGACAVCGMHVGNFPDWASVVTYPDGSQAWFDGPKDLFTYLLDRGRYDPKRSTLGLASIHVKDYYHLKAVDGRAAFYVMGSDVMGPMGRELVPFASEADARGFLKDHQGRKILAFQEITPAVLKSLE